MESNSETEDIKYIFEKILGAEVDTYYYSNEREVFIRLIELLQIANDSDNNIFDLFGIDMSHFTAPLWDSLSILFGLHFGPEASNLIEWYLFSRIDADGNVIPLIDEDGDKHLLDSPENLYTFIKNYCLADDEISFGDEDENEI
jgi:hypothetical protein